MDLDEVIALVTQRKYRALVDETFPAVQVIEATSPVRIMGTSSESIATVKRFFTCGFAVSLLRARRGAFDAAVPAPIVVLAVAVVFSIRFVAFLVVGDEIVEGEAVNLHLTFGEMTRFDPTTQTAAVVSKRNV